MISRSLLVALSLFARTWAADIVCEGAINACACALKSDVMDKQGLGTCGWDSETSTCSEEGDIDCTECPAQPICTAKQSEECGSADTACLCASMSEVLKNLGTSSGCGWTSSRNKCVIGSEADTDCSECDTQDKCIPPPVYGSPINITVVTAGDGVTIPKMGDTVGAHWTATVKGGSTYESTRQLPFAPTVEIGAKNIPEGWSEAMMQMSLGETAIVDIHSTKAFGANGIRGVVPPHSSIQLEIELLKVNDQEVASTFNPLQEAIDALPEDYWETQAPEYEVDFVIEHVYDTAG